MSKPIIVIGGGHAGAQFVVSMRQSGYEGPLTMLSEDVDFPYHKPPLSKAFLKKADQSVQYLKPEQYYVDNNIDVRLRTQVKRIVPDSHQVILADGEGLEYGKLVLATGARARMLDMPGIELKGILALRSVSDAIELREFAGNTDNVVIMGGGFVGLEVASTLAEQGKTVTVIETAPRILGRSVAPIISEFLHKKLLDAGVNIQLDATISNIIGSSGSITHIETSLGEPIEAGLLLLGIGAVVNSELADGAGLDCNNGIVVNDSMQTSDRDIFAIGDCVNYPHWLAGKDVRLESVQNATDQARFVASVINGSDDKYRAVPWFWSEIAGCRLQMTGLSFDADDYVVTGSIDESKFSVFHFAGEKLVSVDSVNHIPDHMLGRKFFDKGILPSKEDVRLGSAHLKDFFKANTVK